MPYEYDDEGGTVFVPDPSKDGEREHTVCPRKACGRPGTVVGVWYNDETNFDWDTFRHDDPIQDELCQFTRSIAKGARI